jgi:hypothetical protein
MTGVRAEPFNVNAAEVVNFGLFLAVRCNGLRVETQAVRPWQPVVRWRCHDANPGKAKSCA